MDKSFHMPIQLKITLLSLGIVAFSIFIGGIILLGKAVSLKEDELGRRLMITAHTIAELPQAQELVQEPEGWHTLHPIIENLRIIHGADYIVVMNQERIRYSHPMYSKLGTVSHGKDESAAFAEHEYLSKAKGDLGISVRAFVPILNNDNQQVGVALVGSILPTFAEMLSELKTDIFMLLFLTLLFGAAGSWILARHIKQQTFQLEPHQISRMLVERTEAFNAMHEGVIAIDNYENITVFNAKAMKMFDISGDVIGKKIREVIADTRLPEILERSSPIYNQEISVQYRNIVSNRVPIKVGNNTIGAVAIFQERTDATKLAEELTGVKMFVEALRVQNHEHMNKLHTIAGLIQLGTLDEALAYVFQITEEQEELTRFLSKNIHHESIAGLLISKVSRGKELGIELLIDRNTSLDRFPEALDHHDFVLILGNLIENAFAALKDIKRDKKQVYLYINQNEKTCEIVLEDNGSGVPDDIERQIFEYGFTTKGTEGSGIGLYLISQIVEKGSGEISVTSEPGEGTAFYVAFPMKKSKEGSRD
ncbi:sensor histidine kinase [Peribacillus cavernae]|uniref:histidine kinase n=1 Tax=Peribacillus cavernae TaxID=1674310 RepID=A0A3S0U7U5_9BACI|nr:sensor histidine kinase [Peribacillus cavernae]MDQ0220262.1 two-component system sensor histidine kinase DctS [Peribacillus cavernae]RUQ31925.1 sensor histidine kinase [Peribacillus cavernae]